MYKRKEGSPTANKRKFLKRTQRQDEPLNDFAMKMRDTLYQARPGPPRDQLKELLIDYLISGLYNQETGAKLRIKGPSERNRHCSNLGKPPQQQHSHDQ